MDKHYFQECVLAGDATFFFSILLLLGLYEGRSILVVVHHTKIGKQYFICKVKLRLEEKQRCFVQQESSH